MKADVLKWDSSIYNKKEYQRQYHIDNREKLNKYSRQHYKDNRKKRLEYGKQYNIDNYRKIKHNILKRKYNIHLEDWLKIWEAQNGKCAICGKKFRGFQQAHTDHNHTTGAIRGLLCQKCNQGMGCFNDDPGLTMKMTEYLLKENVNYE